MMAGKKKILLVLLVLLAGWYFLWRIGWSFPVHESVVGKVFAAIVLLTELLGFLELVCHLAISTASERRSDAGITEDVPDVDVLVTACGESASLLEETLRSCMEMEYPDGKLHVWLCDDGDDDELRTYCEEQGLGYLTREEHVFAKAGNINEALSKTESPLIAVFDADMRPSRSFLQRTVPHMLGDDGKLDERVGYVQTPQCFDSPDLFQRAVSDTIPNEQDYFYFSIEPSRNAINAVILAGTNMLISRKALEEVGGFATDTVTEDFATGIEMQKRGYESVYLTEELACGKVPKDLPSLITQRQRWARGCIRSLRSTRLLSARSLTLAQKVSYLLAIVYWLFPLKRLVYLSGPLLYALAGISVIRCTSLELLACWLPYYAVAALSLWTFSEHRRTPYLSCFYELCLTPFLFVPVLLETVGVRQRKFAVTRKDEQGRWNPVHLVPFLVGVLLHALALVRVAFAFSFSENLFLYLWLLYNLSCMICALVFALSCRKAWAKGPDAPDHSVRAGQLVQLNPVSMLARHLGGGGQE